MHRRNRALSVVAGLLLLAFAAPDALLADDGAFRYPRVYGPTGRPYGPTQSHYQYQRQYGRPWHGAGGQTAYGHGYGHHGYGHHHGHYSFPGYFGHVPYGYHAYGYTTFPDFGYGGVVGVPGYADFGPVYSYAPAAPLVIQPHPFFHGPNPFDNPVLNQAREENDVRWNMPLAVEPVGDDPPKFLEPSSVEAKLKSIRSQGYGDEWLRRTDFIQAYRRYKQAVDLARDRAEPYFRLALAYTGMGSHASAVREIKRGLRLDPSWPTTGLPLDQLLGEDNLLTKTAMLGNVVAWAREDIRDPDRLFLVGVMMHFDGDERAREVFEAAHRLSGGGQHLAAFLNPVPVQPAGDAEPLPTEPQPVPDEQPIPDDLLPLPPGDAQPEQDPAADDPLIPPAPAERSAPGDGSDAGPALPNAI